MKVRTSIVLSIGDELRDLAASVENAVRTRWPMLTPVVAHAHVCSDGTVVRLCNGQESGLTELGGLSDGLAGDRTVDENVYMRNYDLLTGDLRRQQQDTLKSMSHDVRRSDKLLRLVKEHEWQDTGSLFIHVLATSFGAVSSVFPLSLVDILTRDADRISKGIQISSSILYLLPGVFEGGGVRREGVDVARTHATLSELEVALHPKRSEVLAPDCRAWVLGSLDRQRGVSDFKAVAETATRFVICQIEGSLETGEGLANELAEIEDHRRTFVSSFGSAAVGFPRDALRKLGIARGRRKLGAYLARTVEPEGEAVSADVQEWIEIAGLEAVVQQLPKLVRRRATPVDVGERHSSSGQRPREIGSTEELELPERPAMQGATLTSGDWDAEVVKRTEADVAWGAIVQREGDRLFRAHRDRIWQELERRLTRERSCIAHCRVFCEHLAGTGRGLTEVLIGADVRNLESLAFDVQSYFAREAMLDGDPRRLRELKILMIPGKQAAIENAEKRLSIDQETLARLESLSRDEDNHEEGERLRDARKRIHALESDLERYRAELADLRDECDEQERLVDEQRRLACDPVRRHLLLARLQEGNAEMRQEDKAVIDGAVGERDEAEKRYNELDRGQAVINPFALLRRWRKKRAAWSDLVQARKRVEDGAMRHWDRQVGALPKRFAFLIHAEAIRVLDRLRDEVTKESLRLAELEKTIGEYGAAATRANAASNSALHGETGADGTSIVSLKAAERLIADDKTLASNLERIVNSVLPFDVVRAVREKGLQNGFQFVVTEVEEAIGEAVEDALRAKGPGTVIEEADAAGEAEDIARRWRGAVYASRAQVALTPEGPTRTERCFFFVPEGASATVKGFLQGQREGQEPPIWRTGSADYLDVCEVVVGFPCWQIAEIAMTKEALDEHWRQVVAVEGTKQLSLPSHEVLVSVDERDAYAVLQAAIDYLRVRSDDA